MQPKHFDSLDGNPYLLKCIANGGYAISLTPGLFYQCLPDKAEVHGMVRVIDNTGEDYLFDADLFEETVFLKRKVGI